MLHGSPIRSWPARGLGAVAGLVAAVLALGVTELVAGLNREWRSPVLDVGDRIVDNVPRSLKEFAIEQFGTNDKLVLLLTIGAILAGYSMIIGAIGFTRKLAIGIVGIALFGAIGIYMAVTRRVGGSLDDAIPTLIGTSSGAGALYLSYRIISPLLTARTAGISVPAVIEVADDSLVETPSDADILTSTDTIESPSESPTDEPSASRRELLVRSGGVLGFLAFAGGSAGALGRVFNSRFSASQSRTALGLPIPERALAPIPAGVNVGVEGVSSFITSNADFYRIDTALTVPQVPTDTYNLAVKGMVKRELNLSFEELISREVVEHDITLTCVSNTIGGELIGNARWLGIRLDDLLNDAGLEPGATQIVGRSVDGYTCGFPVEAAMDGRNALLAFGMNGEALPLEHGFPVRLIVPGLYGYISATKWLTEIEVTTFEDFQSYWVPRGYSDRAPIKLMSRIDSVDGLGTLVSGADGTAAVGGVAWAQTRGISGVEVSIDNSDWQPAEMGDALNNDTWRQWGFRFTPSGTDHTRTSIKCRAIDGNGVIQTDDRTEPLPNGASGHHSIVVFID